MRMRLDARVRRRLVLASAAACVTACGGGQGRDECPGPADPGLFSGCVYNIACQAWETALVLDRRAAWNIDRSVSPPAVLVRAGSRMIVSVDRTRHSPSGCDVNEVTTTRWVVSDPSVLQIGSRQNHYAELLAVGPGTARVTAENLTMPNTPPNGQGGTVELSACSDANSPEESCSRVPLSIRVDR